MMHTHGICTFIWISLNIFDLAFEDNHTIFYQLGQTHFDNPLEGYQSGHSFLYKTAITAV